MAQASDESIVQRVEALPIIVVYALLLALFMYLSPGVFLAPYIYTTFLSTLPPLILLATGLTFVIGAGEIDLSFPSIIAFSGFVFAVLFKEYELGWIAVIAGLASGVLVGFVNGLLIARSAFRPSSRRLRPSSSGPDGDGALGRQVLRPARRRGELGLAMDRRPALRVRHSVDWLQQASIQALWTALIVGVPLARPHPAPLRRAHPVHRQFERRVAGRRHRRRPREDQDLHPHGFSRGLRRDHAHAREQELLRQPGPGLSPTAIASVLIGGTSIFGGQATILGTVFGCLIIGMIEAGLVASGLTGAWVRTVQGLIFLIAIIFYMYVNEPQRRRALFANMRSFRRFGSSTRTSEEGGVRR